MSENSEIITNLPVEEDNENHPPKCKEDLRLEGVNEGNQKLTGSEYNERLQTLLRMTIVMCR